MDFYWRVVIFGVIAPGLCFCAGTLLSYGAYRAWCRWWYGTWK